MNTRNAFRFALAVGLICWMAVGDVRIVILYDLLVFAACRGLYIVRS